MLGQFHGYLKIKITLKSH